MKSELSIRGGANLRYIRKLRGLSTDDLAGLMAARFGTDITGSAICKYESGDRPITQALTAEFAAVLNCSVATLMDGLDLNQTPAPETQELRQLPKIVHEIFHWVATVWKGNIVALATAFGLYAATPGRYRKYAMMELLTQVSAAIQDGAIDQEDIPACIRQGIPTVEQLLGGLYDNDP